MPEINGFLPLLDAIASHLDEGVLISDRAGSVLYANMAAEKLISNGTPNGAENSIRHISNIENLDLAELMREAFYDRPSTAKPKQASDFLRKFHRVIELGNRERHLEIRCCLTCEQQGRLRLFIMRDISRERRLAAVLDRATSELVTKDPKMIDILRRIDQVAPQQASILLQGESGTGKTHVARLIHSLSPRSDKPFVEVNCAAIPETLLESELFGHVKGAFTGALSNRTGRFQSADGGTLFLDEVGEIPLHLQAKLLRAIQDRKFEPVGSDSPRKVDVRIISSSNRNLRDLVDAGLFRADLFYRLAVIPLHIPAVRERPGDIPLLLKHFCDNMVERGYPGEVECNPEALRILMNYPWPGNVRELENAVEHAVICASNGVVVPESLPIDVRSYSASPNSERPYAPDNREAEAQKRKIKSALKRANGNKTRAAEMLGINRSTLWRRMRRFDIEE